MNEPIPPADGIRDAVSDRAPAPGSEAGPRGRTRIVVVGGGAGGLELVRRLGARFGRKHHDIILVERNRTHIWKPLLHEVAAGSLDANMDEVGYGGHGARWGYRFFNGTLDGIDRANRQVLTAPLLDDDGQEIIGAHRIRYDYLVLAIGGISNDFGIQGVARHALFLDSHAEADRFRYKLLNACLRVSHLAGGDDPGAEAHEAKVRIVIVGGGATGVELAAELYNAALALRHYGLEDFDASRLSITLIEAGPRILPALPDKLADAAREELEALGVTVRVATQVLAVEAHEVHVNEGESLAADLTVWAAGVQGAPVASRLDGLQLDRARRLVVEPTLQTTEDPRIFAIGDCASMTPPGEPHPIGARAQAAHQMVATCLTNLVALMNDRDPVPFVFRDRGSLVSLSRFSTVGSLMGNLIGGKMALEGRLARIAYASLYRMHLLAIHGWFKGLALIVVGHVNAIVRPRLKLH